jgi:hypothetical protein
MHRIVHDLLRGFHDVGITLMVFGAFLLPLLYYSLRIERVARSGRAEKAFRLGQKLGWKPLAVALPLAIAVYALAEFIWP